jgi:AcrR family transcriptional regulator
MIPFDDISNLGKIIPEMEKEELVTRTFRRLDSERQQAVLAALFAEAAEKGPSRMNIKQVAERSGASIGSLYQYFGNRKNLLSFAVKIVVFVFSESIKLWRPTLRSMPVWNALRAYLQESLKYFHAEQSLFKFLGLAAYQGDEDLGKTVVLPIAISMRETVRDILQAGAERGEIRPDADLDASARAVNALLIVLGDSQLLPYLNRYFQVSDDTFPFARTADAALEIIRHGLEPYPPAKTAIGGGKHRRNA